MKSHLTMARRLILVFFSATAPLGVQAADGQSGVWRTRGFEEFRAGTFGNGGQNLYVSRAGVLQRIHQYDLNRDGWFDLVVCNGQDYTEDAPAYLYADPLGDRKRVELPSDGSLAGTVSDLNGDGYDDLVLAMYSNGVRPDLNAIVYFGSPDGLGQRRKLYLPAPQCWSVAAGDFNGDGRKDLAFLCKDGVRLFYQSDLGFEPTRFTTLAIASDKIIDNAYAGRLTELAVPGAQIAAEDLDGDGFTDLIVRYVNGDVAVYWGGPKGLDPERALVVPCRQGSSKWDFQDDKADRSEVVGPVRPLARVVRLNGRPHLLLLPPDSVSLVPVLPDRRLGKPIRLACRQALSAAVGDVNGDGQEDLVVACRAPHGSRERSWIYWGSKNGLSDDRRTPLDSYRACDVAVGDLDGDGCDDVVLCQSHTDERFTSTSLVYRGSKQGVVEPPVQLQTEDARRAFIAKTSDAKRPQVVFVNHVSGEMLGRPDVSIFLGGPDGFKADRRINVAGSGAVHALCCDLNDDAWPDLVLANSSDDSVYLDPGSYVFYNGPKGLPHEPSLRLSTSRAYGAVCADLNHDGYLDLVFCGVDSPDLLVFYGTSHGFDLENPRRIRLDFDGAIHRQARFIQLADLNEDGWLDLIVPLIDSDRSLILLGGPDGFQIGRRQVLSADRIVSATAADLNGTGHLDLLLGGFVPQRDVPHNSFLYIYWNALKGLRPDQRTMLPAWGAHGMAVADFNNDGTLDVFTAAYGDVSKRDCDSFIYWNRPGRGFAATDRLAFPTHSSVGAVAADFNEDGWIDLAIANHKIGSNHRNTYTEVWWNGPKGFSADRITRLPSKGPHGLTPSPGNQRDGGPQEYYESRPFRLPEGAKVRSVRWTADMPAKTWVKAQLRFADTQEALAKSPWFGPEGPESWFTDGKQAAGSSPPGRWLTYRLAMGAKNGLSTPRVREVAIEYGP